MFVSDQSFTSSVHNQEGCTDCHGGNKSIVLFEDAHNEVIMDPSEIENTSCSECHSEVDQMVKNSLHYTLAGEINMITERLGESNLSHEMSEMFEDNCSTCHASCGSCHISRPNSVGGGLVSGHKFRERPSMTDQCTACHGSRIGEEYLGLREGYEPDLHYNALMNCVDCHSQEEMHGDGSSPEHRYDLEVKASCDKCHPVENSNEYHQTHLTDFTCQVCHSQEYKSCGNCHVGEGLQSPSFLSFKIGLNPLRSNERPEKYSLVRKAPVTPNSFSDFGGLLSNFDALPTWKYTTPHNISLWTDRTLADSTGSCTGACHGNLNYFLTQEDLMDLSIEEQSANRNVIVDDSLPSWFGTLEGENK